MSLSVVCVWDITDAKEACYAEQSQASGPCAPVDTEGTGQSASLFLTGPMAGETINGAGIAFKKALIEAALNAELGHHLVYELGAGKAEASTNHRNGFTEKTV